MLKGKKGLVLGLANDKSIAFAVAKRFVEEDDDHHMFKRFFKR